MVPVNRAAPARLVDYIKTELPERLGCECPREAPLAEGNADGTTDGLGRLLAAPDDNPAADSASRSIEFSVRRDIPSNTELSSIDNVR